MNFAPQTRRLAMTGAFLGLLTFAGFPAIDARAAGEAGGTVQFSVDRNLAENLLAFQGKSVSVVLGSGQSVSGVVKGVKNGLLHLEKLSGKDFFDAVIVIDRISSVEARVR